MKNVLSTAAIVVFIISCSQNRPANEPIVENWLARRATISTDSLNSGKTFLPVYSQIYSMTEHKLQDLTATVSLRNTSDKDSLFILSAKYFDTHGKLLRNYFSNPIFIAPLETVQIIIAQNDKAGGTGGNFLFDWKLNPGSPEPLFDAVMISTASQLGMSFTTTGKRIR